ncbi:alginate O-acetyltransferase complex protein AlgI [Oxalobacteraceae bacterium GrIS 2.11]
MLFNSTAFFFFFLPLALLGYYFLSRFSLAMANAYLALASLVFYSCWNISFLPLLLLSIVINYLIGKSINDKKEVAADGAAKRILVAGIVFNLALLGFFKYFDFLITNLAWIGFSPVKPFGIPLPLGISFFTFTQIAYLVDCHSAKVREYKASNYALFVTYFPHLIAGPILHHKEMMPQFETRESHQASRGRFVVGFLFFTLGLFKKVIIADGIARFVGPVFDLNHASLTMLEAWVGALSYTFQLYFDFSAYCDMAYGLSYMFGIILPINFNSPYQARSIIDFWRRWHMTLSRFLRDYLYIPLGGNRRGPAMRYVNLITTMLLGGLWHGANWTFIAWGALHGLYLAINHGIDHAGAGRLNSLRWLGWPVTFLAVVLSWVLFRSGSVHVALDIFQAMWSGTFHGKVGTLGMNRIMAVDESLYWLGAAALVAFFLPNLYQVFGTGVREKLEIKMNTAWGGIAFGVMLMLVMILLAVSETRGVSEFLYFNF